MQKEKEQIREMIRLTMRSKKTPPTKPKKIKWELCP